jgi:tetratricopeptide (TPR) repeat protein
VECHRIGGVAPFSLQSPAEVRKKITEIEEVTGRGTMPPWLPAPQPDAFQGERRLTEGEILLFRRWREGGFVEGKVEAAGAISKASESIEGWRLGTPDLVLKMPAPYLVPPVGKDVYRHFVVPSGITRRQFVSAWEFRPGSRTVHHAFLRVDRTGEGRRRDQLDPEPGFPGMDTPPGIQPPNGHFASWQPGAAPTRNPEGLPWVLEPGNDLVLQAHLQPSGKPEPLQFELGLWFTSKAPTNQPMKIGLVNYGFEIPPGTTNVVAGEEFVVEGDCDLLGVLPHAHYLARRIEGIANLPDGTRKSLILIPEWDFNWQGAYLYQKPVYLPAGTRVQMRIQFDNTSANPRNPFDPPRQTRFGLNTTDEMAEMWLQVLPRSRQAAQRLRAALLKQTTRDVVAYNEQRLRIDPRDAGAYLNLGRAELAQSRTAEAVKHLEKSIALEPEVDEAHYQLGLAHRILGQTEAAFREFNACLRLNPRFPKALGNLGFLELESGNMDSAIRRFRQVIELDRTDALAHATLGMILFKTGQLDEAFPVLQRAVELDPNDGESAVYLRSLPPRPGALQTPRP